MTSEEVEKIVKNLPDDMRSVLINATGDAIDILCKFAEHMRKNYVPISVIEDIQAEIDEQWYVVKRESIERAEGLELASEIIIKHTSGTKMGRWIKLANCSNGGYYCSECQKKVVKEGWSDTVKKIKYCPNCGAKMEGES